MMIHGKVLMGRHFGVYMKEFPSKPGTYLWLPVNPTDREMSRAPYILKVSKDGRFWNPVTFSRDRTLGAFIEVPEEMLSSLFIEAREVFIDNCVKKISAASAWDQKRIFDDLSRSCDDQMLKEISQKLQAIGIYSK